jgi:hypothetical protein
LKDELNLRREADIKAKKAQEKLEECLRMFRNFKMQHKAINDRQNLIQDLLKNGKASMTDEKMQMLMTEIIEMNEKHSQQIQEL